ncbi:MAG: glycosyltransferase family A protein [Patescibacteria group bacterium]
MKLDIILRTHSLGNVHPEKRVMTDSKEEMLIKCVFSLIKSIDTIKGAHDIKLAIIDDHSSELCMQKLKKMVSDLKYPYILIHLEDTGNNASLKKCYEYAHDNARDVIYFVEDDYLHNPSALVEMIESYELFQSNLGGTDIALLPYDDPDNYKPGWIHPSRIVLSKNRYWRTNTITNGTFMISKKVLLDFWDTFMAFTQYGTGLKSNESATINKIWSESVRLFTPMPSLAIHMHHTLRMSPFIDWKSLWDSMDTSHL